MYADKTTESMKKAINETNRRRGIQEKYNKKNGIIPKTITKEISDILQLVEKVRPAKENKKNKPTFDTKNASKEQLIQLGKELEEEMNAAADLLEFEIAARLRDELRELNKELKEIEYG